MNPEVKRWAIRGLSWAFWSRKLHEPKEFDMGDFCWSVGEKLLEHYGDEIKPLIAESTDIRLTTLRFFGKKQHDSYVVELTEQATKMWFMGRCQKFIAHLFWEVRGEKDDGSDQDKNWTDAGEFLDKYWDQIQGKLGYIPDYKEGCSDFEFTWKNQEPLRKFFLMNH